MIKSKEDYCFYVREDKKRNLGAYKIGMCKYLAERIYGTDRMKAFLLLKALRRAEYANNVLRGKGVWGKLIYAYRKWQYHKLEVRYNVSIGINMVGYGFRLPHLIGGGVVIN